MEPSSNAEFSKRESKRPSKKAQRGKLDQILRLGIQVANEIIGFDKHWVYLNFGGESSDILWHFSAGVPRNQKKSDSISRIERARNQYINGLAKTPDSSFLEKTKTRHVLFQRMTLPGDVEGFLSVARPIRVEDGKQTDKNGFTRVEIYHLETVTQLIREAFEDRKAEESLRRLHLNFLACRLLLQEGTYEEIVNAYLGKAAHLCHGLLDLDQDFKEGRNSKDLLAVHVTFKQINDNESILRFTGRLSTRPEEWNEERWKTPYPLPEPGEKEKSIAAEVFTSRKTALVNDYVIRMTSYAREYYLFEKTQRHISAPVVAGFETPLGVLTIETTSHVLYEEYLAHAFTLLAAHAARPLALARAREAASRKDDFITEGLMALRNETSEIKLLEPLKSWLIKQGYSRGLFSRVDYKEKLIVGFLSWGEKMANVEKVTRRDFSDHSEELGDCQVIAVREGKSVRVPNPDEGELAKRDARAVGDLRPFCIYVIKDCHDRVVWTVHLERSDVALHNAIDEALLNNSGERVRKAWEEERRIQFERDWSQQMLRETSHTSVAELLVKFVKFAVEKHVVNRCKVYLIAGKKQTLHDSVGEPRPFNSSFHFEDDQHPILQAHKPALCLMPGHTTTLSRGDSFDIWDDQTDPYNDVLASGDRREWVEIPIRFGEKLVAKIVLDHLGELNPAFTLGEMRLMGRMHRLLEAAIPVIEANQAIARLSVEGLHLGLLLHYCKNELARLTTVVAPERMRAEIPTVLNSLREFDAFLHPRQTPRDSTIGGVLKLARDAGLHLLDVGEAAQSGLQIEEIRAGDYPSQLNGDALSLLLIVISLLDNACTNLSKTIKLGIDVSDRVIRVAARREGNRLVISVQNHGEGISLEKRAEIIASFRDPIESISKLGSLGERVHSLHLCSLLAKQAQWELRLPEGSSPTTFEVCVSL